MLKIRLKRIGRKNHPSFRVVVTESTKGPKSGKVIDTLGFYEPISGKREIESEKAEKWISNGAQPSGTVHNMLVDVGVIKGKKLNVLPKKSPVIKEEADKPKEEVKEEVSAEDGGEGEGEANEVKEEKPEDEAKESASAPAEENEGETPIDKEEAKDEPENEEGTEASEQAPEEEGDTEK